MAAVRSRARLALSAVFSAIVVAVVLAVCGTCGAPAGAGGLRPPPVRWPPIAPTA